MININCNITNPFLDRWSVVWGWFGFLSAHKVLEFNIYRTDCIIAASLNVRIRTDHPGINLMFGVLGYEVEIHMYDTRHRDNLL
jgi:hypothetical protein